MRAYFNFLAIVFLFSSTTVQAQAPKAAAPVPVPAANAGAVKKANLRSDVLGMGVRHFQQIREDIDANWDLLYIENEGKKSLQIYSVDTGRMMFEDTSDSGTFVRADVISVQKSALPLLLTVWARGAHSYEVRILDPIKKKIQLTQTSDYLIDWKVENKILNLTFHVGEKDTKTGMPKEKSIQWDGPEKAKKN